MKVSIDTPLSLHVAAVTLNGKPVPTIYADEEAGYVKHYVRQKGGGLVTGHDREPVVMHSWGDVKIHFKTRESINKMFSGQDVVDRRIPERW